MLFVVKVIRSSLPLLWIPSLLRTYFLSFASFLQLAVIEVVLDVGHT